MNSFLKRIIQQELLIFVLPLFSVAFVYFFHSLPSLLLFLSLVLLCLSSILNEKFFRLFVYLSFSIAIMISLPAHINSLIKYYFDPHYLKIISLSFLVSVISLVGSLCLNVRNQGKKEFLLSMMVLSFVTAFIFRDALLYEKNILVFFLILLGALCNSINIGYLELKFSSFKKIIFLFFLLGLFLTANLVNKKPVKELCLMECFGVWADTKTKFSMDIPTLTSGYSYSLLKEVLEQKYSLATIDDRKKLKEKLQYSQVALIVTPTVPLTDQEIEVIKGFVAQGGRLIIIADHTDLYGHGRVINAFSKELGISVEYDALFYPNNYYAKINLQNMPYSFRPKTPCSLMLTTPGGYVFGWANSWISEMADYTKPNFFGEFQWTSDDIESDWPVGIIKKYGQGEVVVWADSTVFANFCIFQPNTLRFLGCLIEGGKFLAFCSQYGFYLLLLSIISLSFKKVTQSNFFFIILLAVIFSSGCYYFWDFNPELFYPKNKRIDFYGNKELFDEPPPKNLPLDGHISSAYSNVARCGLYPLYIAEKPSKPVSYKSVWVTSWDTIEKVDKKTLQSLWGIVVIDLDNKLENIGFKKIILEENINKPLIEVFPKVASNRKILVAANNVHTINYGGTSVFAAEGVITDHYIGDWWITTNISPYRRFILEEWSNWLNKKNDIQRFFYPPSGIIDGGDEWLIRVEGKDFLKRKMKVIPYKKDMRFVYIGSGIWASYEKVGNEVFLLGGPETSDNLSRSGLDRWAAREY